LNCADDREIAKAFLEKHNATYPNILDTSRDATNLVFDKLQQGAGAVPLSYIVDREGKIADGWYGFGGNHKRGLKVLEELGIETASSTPR
jgi:peroxiredoxin